MRRTIALMGGRDRVLGEARRALDSGDVQWAAELATWLIHANNDDREAREAKARAFRQLGYASMNINWRNWYLVAAHELDGTLDPVAPALAAAVSFSSPDLIGALPARAWVEGFTTRLKAEETLDMHPTLAVQFPGIGEGYALEIRRGVAQFRPRMPAKPDLLATLDKRTLDRILLRQLTMQDTSAPGAIRLTGGAPGDFLKFLGHCERPFEVPIRLVAR